MTIAVYDPMTHFLFNFQITVDTSKAPDFTVVVNIAVIFIKQKLFLSRKTQDNVYRKI